MSTIAKKGPTTLQKLKPASITRSVARNELSQKGISKKNPMQEARTAAKVLANPSSDIAAKTLAAEVLSKKSSLFPVKSYRVTGSSLTQTRGAEIVREVITKKNK